MAKSRIAAAIQYIDTGLEDWIPFLLLSGSFRKRKDHKYFRFSLGVHQKFLGRTDKQKATINDLLKLAKK